MIRSLGKFLPSVFATPPPAEAKSGDCSCFNGNAVALAQKLSSSASVSCETLSGYDPVETQTLFRVSKDEDDWEFAGDEEVECENDAEAHARYLTGAIGVPNLLQFSLPLPADGPLPISVENDKSHTSPDFRRKTAGRLDDEFRQSSACDWLEPPPISEAAAKEESQRRIGGEGVMLEAFQQFQQSPRVQEMVLALATDEGLWRAVLANKKIQEFRFGDDGEGNFEVGIAQDLDDVTAQSRTKSSSFILVSCNAVRELIEGFWDQIRGIVNVVDKKLQADTSLSMIEVILRALIMMVVSALILLAFLCLLPLQASLE